MNNSFFWDKTPSGPSRVNRRFGGTSSQSKRISSTRNQWEGSWLRSLWFLLPTPPYWEAIDTENYNIYRILAFSSERWWWVNLRENSVCIIDIFCIQLHKYAHNLLLKDTQNIVMWLHYCIINHAKQGIILRFEFIINITSMKKLENQTYTHVNKINTAFSNTWKGIQ
jgi:hypothetical protein